MKTKILLYLLLSLITTHQLVGQVTNPVKNWQINAEKATFTFSNESGNEEIRFGIGVEPSLNNQFDVVDRDEFYKWDKFCSPGCSESLGNKKLHTNSTTNNEKIDVYAEWWEGDSAPVDIFNGGDDDYGELRQLVNLAVSGADLPNQPKLISLPSTGGSAESVDLWHRWSYRHGRKSSPLDFGIVRTVDATRTHFNSNAVASSGWDNVIGYENNWTADIGPDVTYKFEIRDSAQLVDIDLAVYWLDFFDARMSLYKDGFTPDKIANVVATSSSTGSINQELCSGVYLIVVDGINPASLSGKFTLSVSASNSNLNPGSISYNGPSQLCETVQVPDINSSALGSSSIYTNPNITYKWQEYNGVVWVDKGFGPDLENIGPMGTSARSFRRIAVVCGVERSSNVINIGYIDAELEPGSIAFLDIALSDEVESYTIPLQSSNSNNQFVFQSLGTILGNADDATGMPSPILTAWEMKGPNDSEFVEMTAASSGIQNWDFMQTSEFMMAGTYKVRRRAENTCGSVYSNEVTIFVQGQLGSILGMVTTPNGAPVIGATVTAMLNNPDDIQGAAYTTKTYTAMTGNQGFTIPDMYFGSSIANPADVATFTVIPSYTVNGTVHTFSPANRIVNIQKSVPSLTQINFVDQTSLTVSGNVSQLLDGVSCGMDTVAILLGINGSNPVPIDSTDANGDFMISLDSPGDYVIEAKYKNHSFTLDYQNYNFGEEFLINQDITGFDFNAETTHTISGKLSDGCGASIGEATVIFQGFNCSTFKKEVTTINNGNFNVTLPAREYKIFVEGHPDPLVNAFFTASEYVDLSERDTSNFLLKYRAQPVVSISGLPADLGCPGEYANVPEIEQIVQYPYEIQIMELKLDNDNNPANTPPANTCPVDTGIVKFIDDIGNRGLVDIAFVNGIAYDTITGGDPNLIAPHLKTISMIAQDTVAKTMDSAPLEKQALVTGIRSTASNFDLVTPELPMMILRDPPGDASSSIISKGTTLEVGTRTFVAKSDSENTWGNVAAGVEFEVGIGYMVETSIWADIQTDIQYGTRNVDTKEQIRSTTFTEAFSTSSNPDIIGSQGDIIIGASQVWAYSQADVISLDGCTASKTQELITAPKAVNTKYIVREGFIRDVTIPSLQKKVENPPNVDSIPFYMDQIQIWQNILDRSQELKDNAVPYQSSNLGQANTPNVPGFPNRITFSGGLTAEYQITASSSDVVTTEFLTEVNRDIATNLGFEIAGAGLSGGVLVKMKTETGKVNSSTSLSSVTTGFTLADDDARDGFLVEILADPVYNTPVFNLISGQTSCPWEPGTFKRDDPQIIALNSIETNIPNGSEETFTLELGNNSETGETRDYLVRLKQSSNDGALVTVAGQDAGNAVLYEDIAFGGTQNITVKVSQDDPNKFSFEGLEFLAYENCPDPNITDEALISAFFQGPCTNITLSVPDPMTEWVYNSNSAGMTLTFNGYTKPGLDEVRIDYQLIGESSWVNAIVIPAAQVLNNVPAAANLGTTVQVDLDDIPDGEYAIRVTAVCNNNISNFSLRSTGIKDTRAPQIFGLANPVDDIFDIGDEISAVFNEDVKPINQSDADVKFYRLDGANGTEMELSTTFTLASDRASIVPNQVISPPTAPGAYRVVMTGIEDLYGNVAESMSWTFITPGYESPVCNDSSDLDNDGIDACDDLCPYDRDTALDFQEDGHAAGNTSDYVEVPHAPEFNLTDGDFTFEAWVNPNLNDGEFKTIISKGHGFNLQTNYIFGIAGVNNTINFAPGRLGLSFTDSLSSQWQFSNTAIPQNTWTHVAVSVDQSDGNIVASFYVNGIADGVRSFSLGTLSNGDTNSLFIGRQGFACQCNFYDGMMDEVAIWDKALPVQDIAASIIAPYTGTETDLIAYYDFNDADACAANGANTILADVANSHNGTLINFDLSTACTSNWTSGRNLGSCSTVACPPSLALDNTQNTNAAYESGGTIMSSQIINSPSKVDYDATTEISLLDGFEVKVGAIFHAYIDGCGENQ